MVYGNKKKKPTTKPDSVSNPTSSIPSTPTVAPPSLPELTSSVISHATEEPAPSAEPEISGVKDDWDASTDEDEDAPPPITTSKSDGN